MQIPKPVDTSSVILSKDLMNLSEKLAANIHDRDTALETIKLIIMLGYDIEKGCYAAHPGELLIRVLAEKNLWGGELAKKLGVDPEVVQRIFDGNEPITPTIAERLEKITETPKSFWLSAEDNYRKKFPPVEKMREGNGPVTLCGQISSYDKILECGELYTPTEEYRFQYEGNDSSAILESLSHKWEPNNVFVKQPLVLLSGKRIYNEYTARYDYIINSVKKTTCFNPVYRIGQLHRNHWVDGDKELAFYPGDGGLEWLKSFFEKYPETLLPPLLGPWEGPIVSAEWTDFGKANREKSNLNVALDINLNTHIAEGCMWDYDDDDEIEPKDIRFKLDKDGDVHRLFDIIKTYGTGFMTDDAYLW